MKDNPAYLKQRLAQVSEQAYLELYEYLLEHSLNRDTICLIFHFVFDTRYPDDIHGGSNIINTKGTCNDNGTVEARRFHITSKERLVDFFAIEPELGINEKKTWPRFSMPTGTFPGDAMPFTTGSTIFPAGLFAFPRSPVP